ncbi:hypothetical protein [Actinomyces oris]|nr:hypothetical protein [Actinomyces oris]
MPDIIKKRGVRSMSIRRREVLALGAASLAFTVGGCSPFAVARSKKKKKVRNYLYGLDGVTSVEIYLSPNLMSDDRWSVTVNLKDDPAQDSLLAIVRDARNEVVNLVDSDEVGLEVRWVQGTTSMSCTLPMNDPEKAVLAAMKVVSSEIESVGLTEASITLRYSELQTLPDDFILPKTSPIVGVGSLKTEQDVTVSSSYCVITHSNGVDLTSVPLRRVLDAIPPDKRSDGAFVRLDAADVVNHRPSLGVNGLGKYGDGVDVSSAAAVLATVLGNQTLERVELGTQINDDYDSKTVTFDMKAGAVVGQGDPPEKGAPILAAAQQAASSSS